MGPRRVLSSAPVAWTAYAGAVAAASLVASVLRPADSPTSLWWPAAGVAVVGALLIPGDRRREATAVVLVVTSVTNLITGRPLVLSMLFGVANAAEVAVAVALLGPGRPALGCLADVRRLLVAALAGAVTVGALAGLTLWLCLGQDGVVAARQVTTSHLSALLLLVPLITRHPVARHEARVVEEVAQALLLVALLVGVFLPEQDLPLAFLPIIGLVWAGARLGAGTAIVQLVLSGLYATAAALLDWGPFAGSATGVDDDPFVTIGLVQAYLVVTSVVTLTLVAVATERRLAFVELQQLALRDELTQLPNRRLLFDRLELAASAVRHDGGSFTVLLIDLDGFKQVNDTAGHETGDEVLIETARRLHGVVRPGDTVARLGGDEFAVVCPGLGPGPAVEDLVHRVGAALGKPVATPSGTHLVRASIGVAHGTASSRGADVLRVADHAMYEEKVRRRLVHD